MIYLDNSATTQPNPNMLQAAVEEVTNYFGNPSSSHLAGQEAKKSIEKARDSVAKALGVKASTIIFTSGGTESNNIALFGLSIPSIVSQVEHSSVYNCHPEHIIPINNNGEINISKLENIISIYNSPFVLSVMLANNETGIILDPENKIAELKQKYNFVYHVDAVQGFGKVLNYKIPESVDMLSISGHKVHALKGVGALYVKEGIELNRPFVAGGSHEFGIRPGTENHIGIFSLGFMANKIDSDSFYRARISNIDILRDLLEISLSDISHVNGKYSARTNNISNLYFPDVSDVELFVELISDEGLCVSAGSACSSGVPEPSRVLVAMFGKDSPETRGSIRISLSVDTTKEIINKAEKAIRNALKKYKEIDNE